MIILSATKSTLFKQIGTLLYLSSHLNKTYGSINKPINQFGQNTKFMDPKTSLKQQKTSSEEPPQQENVDSHQSQNYFDEQHSSKENKFKQKQNKDVAFFFKLNEEEKLNTIEEYRQNEMVRELSIICKEMYFYRERSQPVWAAIEGAFISFIKPPYDQDKIRSLSVFLNGLVKSKRTTKNYETPMIQILPHSSMQSFTQIVVMISRIGPMSQEFAHEVEKLYWKRREQFGPLEINLINYALAKNGRKIDTSLVQSVDSFTLRGIALMLKTFDRAGHITPTFLKRCVQPILSRKAETSFFDLKHIVNVYLKHQYFENFHLLHYFDEQYRNLSLNVNEQTLEDIWQYFPDAVNRNKLPPSFVEQVIKSLKILKSRGKISERGWKKFESTFNKFQNKDVKEELKKLSSL